MSRKILQDGINIEVGRRIKKVRGDLSQFGFGKILGVGQAAVSNYEKGRVPDGFTLKKIADHGGVTVEWILHGEEAKQLLLEESLLLTRSQAGVPGLVEPTVFAYVDKSILADIIERVEEGLKRKKRPLGSQRKAHLISLLYDEYQKTGRPPDKSTIQDFLDLV